MCVCVHTHTHTFCCLVTKLCSTLCDSMDYSIPGSSALHCLPEFAQIHVHWVGHPCPLSWMSKQLILYHPLLLPSIFPSIRVFSNELALHIRWPKYWSFSFSISPPNELSGLISFSIDWCDLLAVQGTLKSLLQLHSFKASILWCTSFFVVQLTFMHEYWKKHNFDCKDLCQQGSLLAKWCLCFLIYCLGLS